MKTHVVAKNLTTSHIILGPEGQKLRIEQIVNVVGHITLTLRTKDGRTLSAEVHERDNVRVVSL